jgi:hypothetical protein
VQPQQGGELVNDLVGRVLDVQPEGLACLSELRDQGHGGIPDDLAGAINPAPHAADPRLRQASVPIASDVLPDPDTPAIATVRHSGTPASTSRKLLCRTPRTPVTGGEVPSTGIVSVATPGGEAGRAI